MTATAMIELQLELLKEAKDRIAELEADKQRLWDSIEAGESVYKRKCAKLEAKLENLDSVVTAHWDVLPLDFKLIYGANKTEAMEDTQ